MSRPRYSWYGYHRALVRRWRRRSRDDVARTVDRALHPDAAWYLPYGQYRRLSPMRAAYRRKQKGWRP